MKTQSETTLKKTVRQYFGVFQFQISSLQVEFGNFSSILDLLNIDVGLCRSSGDTKLVPTWML